MGKVKKNPIEIHPNLPVAMNPLSRRMFLGGLGSALALPFLPSLFPAKALAAEADYRKAVLMAYSHGLYWDNWRPQGVSLSDIAANVRAGSLTNATFGSYFPTEFNSIRNKISILEGLDHLNANGHSHNAPFAAGGHKAGNDWEDPMSPNSIDVLLGKSSSFYPVAPRIPVLRTNISDAPYSFHYENGNPQIVDATNPQDLFNKVTGAVAPTSPTPNPTTPTVDKKALRRKLIVDSALGSIQALLGSTKIASADRNVASNYFDHLRDVQTRINAEATSGSSSTPMNTGSGMSCNPAYNAPTDSFSTARNIVDTMILALACGATKLSTMILPSEHDLVHRVDDPDIRVAHANYLRQEVFFVPAYLMTKMDSIVEGNGKTMLENSLALLTSDNGNSKYDNHCGLNVPVLLGGGLNGMFRMGQYVSYYDQSAPVVNMELAGYPGAPVYGGRPYNDLMITIMRSLGMRSSEYVDPATGGFGSYGRGCSGCEAYPPDPNTTNGKTQLYYANKYLPAHLNKDVTLPYIYLGS